MKGLAVHFQSCVLAASSSIWQMAAYSPSWLPTFKSSPMRSLSGSERLADFHSTAYLRAQAPPLARVLSLYPGVPRTDEERQTGFLTLGAYQQQPGSSRLSTSSLQLSISHSCLFTSEDNCLPWPSNTSAHRVQVEGLPTPLLDGLLYLGSEAKCDCILRVSADAWCSHATEENKPPDTPQGKGQGSVLIPNELGRRVTAHRLLHNLSHDLCSLILSPPLQASPSASGPCTCCSPCLAGSLSILYYSCGPQAYFPLPPPEKLPSTPEELTAP